MNLHGVRRDRYAETAEPLTEFRPPRVVAKAAVRAPVTPRRRPIIGVTGPDRGGDAAWFFTWFCLTLCGASARRLTPSDHVPLGPLDGLIIGGGADVDPQLYGEPLEALLQPTSEQYRSLWRRLLDALVFPLTWLLRQLLAGTSDRRGDADRDRLEWALLDRAIERGLPVLGICRGAQLLNVYFGGTLHRSLAGFYVETLEIRSVRPRKVVRVEPSSRLVGILGGTERWVNSLHRQAVDKVGRELRVVATDRNGIVQAIEHEQLPFVVGVQWHPEFLPQRPEQLALFRALVRAARLGTTEARRLPRTVSTSTRANSTLAQ